MDKLAAPVPPMLSDALGYTHDAEWLGFWWEAAGDELRWSDGRVSTEGDWRAYLAYTRHPAVSGHLEGYDFGSSEREGEHRLLLHRPALALYAAMLGEAERVLAGQWGDYEEEAGEYTPEELGELARRLWEEERQRQTFMQGRRERAAEEMGEWLDAQPVTRQQRVLSARELEEALRRMHGEL